jgi:hypothetical protein
MAVSVDICNQALSQVGASRVTAVDGSTEEGTQCKLHYLACLKKVLTERHWTFATGRRELAQSTTPPAYGYTYSYTLPADCLRVRKASNEDGEQYKDWVAEGRAVSTNEDTCFVEYTRFEQDSSVYSGPFEAALVYLLASRLAIPLVQSRSMKEMMYSLYKEELREASPLDGTQGSPTTIGRRASRLIDIRRS